MAQGTSGPTVRDEQVSGGGSIRPVNYDSNADQGLQNYLQSIANEGAPQFSPVISSVTGTDASYIGNGMYISDSGSGSGSGSGSYEPSPFDSQNPYHQAGEYDPYHYDEPMFGPVISGAQDSDYIAVGSGSN